MALKVHYDCLEDRVSPKAEHEVECVEVDMQLKRAKQVEVSNFLQTLEIDCAYHHSHQVQVRGHRYGHKGDFFREHPLREMAEYAALDRQRVIQLRRELSVIPTVLKV